MEFLVVVAALLLHRVIPDLGWLQRDGWYRQWVAQLSENSGVRVRYITSLALPLLAVIIITVIVKVTFGPVSLFLFELLLLLYCIGRGNLNAQLKTLEEDFGRDDKQAAYHAASMFNVGQKESAAENDREFHSELLKSVSYRFFEHVFPVLFWFMAFGVPGALLYRLAQIHTDCQLDKGEEKLLAERWLWIMEWLPARLLGFTFALVGNFASTIQQWRICLVCTVRTTREVLGHYVEGAISANIECEDMEISVAELEMIKRLFERAMVLWVSVIALLIFV